MTSKIAQSIPELLQKSSETLRKIASDNEALLDENAALRHELRLTKLAQRMEERRLEPGLSVEEKVASLRGLDVEKLSAFEAAVELTAGGFHLGDLKTPEDHGTPKKAGQTYPYSEGEDPLDAFINSGAAYGAG